MRNGFFNFFRGLTNIPRYFTAKIRRKPFHRTMRVSEENKRMGVLKARKRARNTLAAANPEHIHKNVVQENLNNLRKVNLNAVIAPEIGNKGSICYDLRKEIEKYDRALQRARSALHQTGTPYRNRALSAILPRDIKNRYRSLDCDRYLRNNPLNTTLPLTGNIIRSIAPENSQAMISHIRRSMGTGIAPQNSVPISAGPTNRNTVNRSTARMSQRKSQRPSARLRRTNRRTLAIPSAVQEVANENENEKNNEEK